MLSSILPDWFFVKLFLCQLFTKSRNCVSMTYFQDDLEFARAKVLMGGVDSSLSINEEDTFKIAAHEAGHAIMEILRVRLKFQIIFHYHYVANHYVI